MGRILEPGSLPSHTSSPSSAIAWARTAHRRIITDRYMGNATQQIRPRPLPISGAVSSCCILITAVVIGAEAGHPQLPRIYAAMVQQLFPPSVAPTLDRSVYSAGKGRMWRVPNRRRSDNGRYKVPLAMREVLHKPSTELEALTHRPRKGLFWLSEEELSPCPALVELYHQVRASMEQAAGKPLVRHHVRDSGGAVWRLVERCAAIRHSREHAATLSEPEWYAMISNVARCADGPAAVHRLSAPYPGSGVTQGFVAVPEREAPPKALGNRAGA
jgi:hypothetical protein